MLHSVILRLHYVLFSTGMAK